MVSSKLRSKSLKAYFKESRPKGLDYSLFLKTQKCPCSGNELVVINGNSSHYTEGEERQLNYNPRFWENGELLPPAANF